MRQSVSLLAGIVLLVLPAASIAADRFDGRFQTKISCPAKGNTDGFTWNMESVMQNSGRAGVFSAGRQGERRRQREADG
jgi:hypothetical protein